jgi:hypothetical protein
MAMMAIENNRPRGRVRVFPAVSISVPKADEPDQKSRNYADRCANCELIGQRIGNAGTDKDDTGDDCTGNSDDAAQQPSWEESAEQIERRRAAAPGAASQGRASQRDDDDIRARFGPDNLSSRHSLGPPLHGLCHQSGPERH